MISDDEMARMPWTRGGMTIEEFDQWVATREEAGRRIDIETCERDAWKAYDLDPYGIRDAKGELNDEMKQIGTNRFVRSPMSGGWIWEGDLPAEKGKALYARIRREVGAYTVLDEKLEAIASELKLRDETNNIVDIENSWGAARNIRAAVAEFANGRGALDVGTIGYFVRAAIEAGIKAGRARQAREEMQARHPRVPLQ
jgi:hypothetical protein